MGCCYNRGRRRGGGARWRGRGIGQLLAEGEGAALLGDGLEHVFLLVEQAGKELSVVALLVGSFWKTWRQASSSIFASLKRPRCLNT